MTTNEWISFKTKKKKKKIRQKHAFLHLKQIQNEYFMIHQLFQMMGATTGNWQQMTNAILFVISLIEKNAMCIVRASRLLVSIEALTIFASENAVWLIDWRFSMSECRTLDFNIRNCNNNNNNTT